MPESVFTQTTPPPFAARVCGAMAGLEAGVSLPGALAGVVAVGAAGLLAGAVEADGLSGEVCAASPVCFGFLSFLVVFESALVGSPACCGACARTVTLPAASSRDASRTRQAVFMIRNF